MPSFHFPLTPRLLYNAARIYARCGDDSHARAVDLIRQALAGAAGRELTVVITVQPRPEPVELGEDPSHRAPVDGGSPVPERDPLGPSDQGPSGRWCSPGSACHQVISVWASAGPAASSAASPVDVRSAVFFMRFPSLVMTGCLGPARRWAPEAAPESP